MRIGVLMSIHVEFKTGFLQEEKKLKGGDEEAGENGDEEERDRGKKMNFWNDTEEQHQKH